MMPPVGMAANTTPHRLPPLTVYPKSVSPSRDSSTLPETHGRGLQETRGVSESVGTKDRQEKAARKRELARRHLSNSLQGLKTILPDLRKTQPFNVPAPNGAVRDQGRVAVPRREAGSLGVRKPPHDIHEVNRSVRRCRSLRETGRTMESPSLFLSQSLPQAGNLSLAALVHELNASMYHHPSPPRPHNSPDFSSSASSGNAMDALFDYENGLDPDLCPRLTGQDGGEVPERTLTPALRKLNRRRVSSRVRTQQWVNQIEEEQRRSELLRKKETEARKREVVPVALLYEQDS